MPKANTLLLLAIGWWMLAALPVSAEWTRFRGPNGSGVAPAGEQVPLTWGDDQNVAWKVDLPGPGSSSPIIVGDKVIITCYSGYGTDDGAGSLGDLLRHTIAFDTKSGKQLWDKTIAGSSNEDEYRGFIGEHGYASSTPVSDGERIYSFFGKAGVVAYDLNGAELWKTDIGQGSGPMKWGSGASPIVHDGTLIVNASEESSALVGLDKKTGSIVWEAKADGVGNTWGTPIVVGDGEAAQLVLGVPNEIWGLNPQTGKLRWFAEALPENSFCSSLVTDGSTVFAIEGRGGGAVAVRTGGKNDVSSSHIAWRGRCQGRVTTPVLYEGRIYSITRGVVQCLDAKTGEQVYQTRLAAPGKTPEPVPADASGGRPGGAGGRGGGGQDYSSPIVVDGHIVTVNRSGVCYVFKAGPTLEVVAMNKFESDSSKYNGSPAVADDRLFLRSDNRLYCIAAGSAQ